MSSHVLVLFLEINLFADNENPDLSSFTPPRIFATHIPYSLLPQSMRDSESKIVYLCRNVKDTFVSLWHFTDKLRLKERDENVLEEVFDKFCRGMSMYGHYWDHVLGYRRAGLEMPEKVLFLKFEDLKARPLEIVKKLAEFIGCPLNDDEDEDEAANEILLGCVVLKV